MKIFSSLFRRGEPAELAPAERRALDQDLMVHYASPVPDLTWDAAVVASPAAGSHPVAAVRPRRRALPAIAAAGLAVAAVAVALPLTRGTEQVSAQELIDRSQAATLALADGSTSYHMVVEYALGDGNVMRTETWRDGVMRREESTVSGGAQALYGHLTDGESLTVYETRGGDTRAVRAPLSVAQQGFGGGVAEQNLTLADAIADVYIPGCQEAKRDGETSHLGRKVYVIEIEATGRPCGTDAELSRGMPGKTLRQEATAWIDAETFVVLRTEQRDLESGSSSTMSVSVFEPGIVLDSRTFTYAPPPGVTVIEANDMYELKEALAQPLGAVTGEPSNAIGRADPAAKPNE